MEGVSLLVAFLFSIGLVMYLIMKLKVNAFLSLMGVSFLLGVLTNIPLTEIPGIISAGFGGTLGGVGIVIALGIMLGEVLHRLGCTEQIANTMIKAFGYEKSPLAMTLTGYIIAIPVFFDAAFVILVELAKELSVKTQKRFITYVTGLAVGLIVAHCVMIPTPRPLAVISAMNANLGFFLFYALIVSVFATLTGGLLYGSYLGKQQVGSYMDEELATNYVGEEVNEQRNQAMPSGKLAIFLLLFPIILILVGTFSSVFLPEESSFLPFLEFLGDKNVALFFGLIVSVVVLRKYFTNSLEEMISGAGSQAGMIMLITGAGGSFGAVISATGIGDYIVETMQGWGISLIVLSFLITQILRASLGSATVALVTTSAIMAPLAAQTGESGILVALAICLGGTCLSLPNDSGFWVVNRFSGLTMTDTLKAWTVGGTISGVTGLILVLILNVFSSFLPGL